MDIIKNNIVSIILGVIALIALTTPLWLLPGYSSDLAAKAKASEQTGSTLTSLLNKPRTKPGVGLDGQPSPLNRFPNDQTIAEGVALQKKVAGTAQTMTDAVRQINLNSVSLPGLNQVLLVPDSLPQPRNQSAFEFRDRYISLAREDALAKQLLNGGLPPNKDEIDAQITTLGERIQSKFRTYPGGGDNRAELEAEFKEQSAQVAARMIRERAGKLKMYVDPGAFAWHPAFSAIGGQSPNQVVIWQAQLGLWIQTAFAKAIAEVNAPAKDVRDAVVKRLVRIEIPENPYVTPQAAPEAAGGAGGAGGMPVVATTEGDPAAPLPHSFERSLTGRVSNPLFDVVHFRAILHVEHDRVPLFLQMLGKNRLMYVLSMQAEAIDPVGLQLQGFIYGPKPVVELSLELEMLFVRSWTAEYMPDPVRVLVGIPPRNPAAFANPSAGGYEGDYGGPPRGRNFR